MPIDTRDRRMSMIALALPSGRVLPHRDGTVTADDFEHLLYLYRGIPAASPAMMLYPSIILASRTSEYRWASYARTYVLQAKPRTYTLEVT